MDKSIVAVEESHRRSDSLASAPKPLGSLVQINSIAIDLNCSMEEIEAPMHEHFSIRGFVAGMRRKDKKRCSPFASESHGDNDEEDLPPLSIPKFRWWQCSECFPDITTPKMLLTDINNPSTSSCPNVGGSFSHSVGDIGGEHNSRVSINQEDNNLNNKVIDLNQRFIAGHKAITWNEVKTVSRNNEGGNSSACIKKTNRHHNNADASDIACISGIPSIRFNEPENALPQKRKPKLRSLADIIEVENSSTSQNTTRTRSTPSNGMQVILVVKEADTDSHLQLDAPTDIASGIRKRKSILVEDKGSLETTSLVGTPKRLKGPILDMEKTSRVDEVSNLKSRGNNPARSDLQLGGKTTLLKPKRKTKQVVITNRASPTRDWPKTSTANLQKRNASSETKRGNSSNVPATFRGKTNPYFNSFISGKQVDRNSNASRIKRPEVEGEYFPIVPPKKSFLEDCNVPGKVALNLSLNSYTGGERSSNSQTSCKHRGIPDLNESYTEKPSLTQENRSSNLHGYLVAIEGKRPVGPVSDPQVEELHNNDENSDEIPMEIVELLAKNQRERELENSRINCIIEEPPICMEGRSNMIEFSFTNAMSGINVPTGKARPSHWSMNFPQARNCHPDISNQDEGQFGLLRPSQQKRPLLSTSNSVISMSGSRPTEGDDLLWPPWRKEGPFNLNCSVQPNSLGVHPISDQQCKGKGIGDIKGHKGRKIGPSSKSAGSLDAYSNDTIPAMQLLSLKDRGTVTGSSSKVGSKSYLDKPFSPGNHHPRLNRKEKQNDPFPDKSFFSQTSHTKDFPTLLNGVLFSGENFKKPYTQGQMHPQLENTKALHSEGPSSVLKPSRGHPALEVCILNRNPADFTILDSKNEFTISAKDLKSRKRTSLKERCRATNVDVPKRLNVRKDASGKELSRK